MAEQTKRLTDAELEALRRHTPGPWRVRDGRQLCIGIFVDAPEALIDNGMGRTYATQILGDDDYATKEVDCRAVAALPELIAEVIERRSRDAAVAELVEAAACVVLACASNHSSSRLSADDEARLRAALAAVRGGAK